MAQERLTAVLKTAPLFAGLDERELAALTLVARQRTYPKGQIIFLEGDPGDALYLIVAGEVKVFKLGTEGREFILTWLRAGDFFGEMSLFDGRPRSASVMASEEATLVVLPQRAFLAQVQHSCPILLTCLRTLCHRLRGTDEQVADLALLETYQRIAKALLLLGRAIGVPGEAGELVIAPRSTHHELASLVGASRETVTRVCSALAKQGYLAFRRHAVVIREALLTQLSEW